MYVFNLWQKKEEKRKKGSYKRFFNGGLEYYRKKSTIRIIFQCSLLLKVSESCL